MQAATLERCGCGRPAQMNLCRNQEGEEIVKLWCWHCDVATRRRPGWYRRNHTYGEQYA